MLEQYSLNGICYMSNELITLENALLKYEYVRHYSELNTKTLGYIKYIPHGEYVEFIPVTHHGKYLREV